MTYADRADAGRALASALMAYADEPRLLVLGLPRGGVPVAAEVARQLNASLDVFVVRKLGVPGHRELAFGALASGGVRFLNDDIIGKAAVTAEDIDRVTNEETVELVRRERSYRADEALPGLAGRTVIVVDDGMATGATMRAALTAVRALGAARVVCAVPVASGTAIAGLRDVYDDAVCPKTPHFFRSVGEHYLDFTATTDDEVRAALGRV